MPKTPMVPKGQRPPSLELQAPVEDRNRQNLRGLPGFEAQAQALVPPEARHGLRPHARQGPAPAALRPGGPRHHPGMAASSVQDIDPAAPASSGAHHPAPASSGLQHPPAPPSPVHEVDPAAPASSGVLDELPDIAHHQAPPQGGQLAQPVAAGARPALAFGAADPQVIAVVALVAAYNALGPEATHQQRFAALRAIDTTAYQVFQDNPVAELPMLPFGTELRALLMRTEVEHADIVDDLRQRTAQGEDGHLPVDASNMDDHEKGETAALWQSIVRGEGDLSVAGSPEFQKGTYGGLAKLMQGHLGRRLIGHLDRKAPPGADGQVPDRGVSILESEMQPGAMPRHDTADMRDVGAGAQPEMDPRELVESVLAGDRSAALGGRQFEFAGGTAVDVAMPSVLHDTRSHSTRTSTR